MIATVASTSTGGKNEEIQCIFAAVKRLDEFREAGSPSDFEDWCVTCRSSELQSKQGVQPTSRLSFNFEGHWPVAKHLAEEQLIGAQKSKHHPQELDTAGNFTLVGVDRLICLCLRASGLQKMPGKAPIGGLAYGIRGKQ